MSTFHVHVSCRAGFSVQKTHQSALQVQQKAEALLQANHYDMDMIRDCAEKVASHWQQLMLKMEDRLKLVNASVAFYKTSEQVRAALLSWKWPSGVLIFLTSQCIS